MKARRFAATAAAGTLLSLSAGTSVALAATPAPYPPPGLVRSGACVTPPHHKKPNACYEAHASMAQGYPGQPLTISNGPGTFDANETYQVWFFSSGEELATGQANADGSFSITVTIPDVHPGQHTVEAVGNTSNNAAAAGIRVLAAAPASGGASGLPFTGADVLPLTSAGAGLILAGGLTVFLVRRRRPRSGHAA